jgi:DsbC/DsbD-like thiol-disulfide interchange protein
MRFQTAVVALGLFAQSSVAPATVDSKYLTVEASTGRASAGRVELYLDVAPKLKMHVYAPDKMQTYIPVALTIDAADGVKPLSPKFPTPEKYFFAPLKETQLVYSKPFRIVQEVALPSGAGPQRVTGTLRYQACDDTVCYMPQTVKVSWPIGEQ